MKLALCTGTLDRDGAQGERQKRDIEVFSGLASIGKLKGVQLFITPETRKEDLSIFRDLQQKYGIEYVIHGAHVGTNTNFPDPNFDSHNRKCIKEARMAHEILSAIYTLFHPGGSPKININGKYKLYRTDSKIGKKTFGDMARIMLDTFDAPELIFENEPHNDFNREILFCRANDLLSEFPILNGTGVCYDVVHAYVSAVQTVAEALDREGKLNPGFKNVVYDPSINPRANLVDFLRDRSEIVSVKNSVLREFDIYHEEFMNTYPSVFQMCGIEELALIDQYGDAFGTIGEYIRKNTMNRVRSNDFVVYEGSTIEGKRIIETLH